jgi:hypothetical protein
MWTVAPGIEFVQESAIGELSSESNHGLLAAATVMRRAEVV